MKNKIIVLVSIAVFAALIVGAVLLYDGLKDDASPGGQLSTFEPQKNEETPKETEKEPESNSRHESSEGRQEDSESEEPESNPAPDFTVYDIEGKAVKLSDFIGKPTVLNFWASWCGPCQSEMPDFEEKYRQLGDEINFVMVNLTDGSYETVSGASNFIKSKGYTFPVYYDTDESAANTYAVYSIPTTYFIDAEGNLIAKASGAINAATLQKGIDMIK